MRGELMGESIEPVSAGSRRINSVVEQATERLVDDMDISDKTIGRICNETSNVEMGYNEPHLREINITPLNSGYLVRVGCQSVAVETTDKLVKSIEAYLTDPSGFERTWNSNKNRNKLW